MEFFRKTICEAAIGVLRKKVRSVARNISEKALCLILREGDLVQELSE